MFKQDVPGIRRARDAREASLHRSCSVPVLLIAAVVGVLLLRSNAAASPLAATDARVAQQAIAGTYRWSYSVKFVCGYQPEMKIDPGVAFREPVVKPGNYATDININNPQGREQALVKWITVMVQGQEVLGPGARQRRSAHQAQHGAQALQRHHG